MKTYKQLREAGTQGEWTPKQENGSLSLYSDKGDVIVEIYDNPGEEQAEANAQLIAHEHNNFPKLLAALEKIANYDEQPIWSDDRDDAADAMLELAREALTAATNLKEI